jgi:ATP-dependent Lhr-like helicase
MDHHQDPLAPLSGPVRAWFARQFPGGPTPAQALAWPAIAAREHSLLISPTGSGKTLAAFLAVLDRLAREQAEGRLSPGLRCVYVSPLRSLGYDVEANLQVPLAGLGDSAIQVGVRTGDTPAHERRKLRERPPHLLVTTPESLALMLAQPAWRPVWKSIEYLIVDEVHALVPTKRGADLAVSLERLAGLAGRDPCRVGLSATCRPADPVARFLVGPGRTCRVLEAVPPPGSKPTTIHVESLLNADEAPHRGLTYRRLLRRLRGAILQHRTTVVFANTRAFTERITHDLRATLGEEAVAAHHSALDASRRREVESRLKSGSLRAVVTSTSLELGVDIGTADLAVLVGLPGSASRCLQRVGRAGHGVGEPTFGLMLAATPAELAGAIVTQQAALAGQVEPIRSVNVPLDVLSQQLIGMACLDEGSTDDAFALLRRTAPFETLERHDLDSCLNYLAGELASPPGAYEAEPGSAPRFTSPRVWKARGRFGLRHGRVRRWFYSNVGTITSEESVRVLADGAVVGTLEGAYADRLQPGDRFVLDGRALAFLRRDSTVVHARRTAGEPDLPRWSSDRQGLSSELALDLARFRERAGRLLAEGPSALRAWLVEDLRLDGESAGVLEDLFAAQQAVSEVPAPDVLLIESSPSLRGLSYTFHAPLGRAACEALGRATAARLGRQTSQDLALKVADLGWSVDVTGPMPEDVLPMLVSPDGFEEDVLAGLDRGDLLARRFRHVATTGFMVLRNPEGGRLKVGGWNWVATRLWPLVKAACPDHPLLRETRREVLEDLLDARAARSWLESRPTVRLRCLDGLSPFAAAWIDPSGAEPLQFEPPGEALRRLHARLTRRSGQV